MADDRGHGLVEDRGRGPYRVFCGLCPDEECQAKLFFPSYDTSIECTSCGQRHERRSLRSVEEVTNPEVMIHNILRNMLLGKAKPKKGADSVKVLGLSNFQCKMISPQLTRYGMDRQGQAKLLSEMGQGVVFDCAKLGDRAFLLEPENIDVIGYGRDRTGSMNYLKDTLYAIRKCNDDEERLLPIHADGDGHCLVHAVSRALVGRELFWHALRENLKEHFKKNLQQYKMLFRDFVDKDEWMDIIEECDPEFIPQDGEPLGLRNIHIFGLSNVLHRPIILLDSISGIQSSGDYSGVFVPGLVDPSLCRNKEGVLNKPLCLAWSSSGRNHYIALVGVKGRPVARLPGWMLPKAWGMPQEQVSRYIDLDLEGCCFIGGDKCLQDKYILRLVRSMESVFLEQFAVSPALVADVHQYVYKSTGMVGVKPEMVLGETQREVNAKRLYRCLTCEAVSIYNVTQEGLTRGGKLYQLALETHGPLRADKNYSFPLNGLICSYDAEHDVLIPDMNRSRMTTCQWCQGTQMRLVAGDGTIQYTNGDRTTMRTSSSRCQCGFKHYWDGKEYDNLPEIFPVTLEWNGKVVGEKVVWFQYESDVTLNSNVFEVAQGLVQKHFPGAFGSERLVMKVVDSILRQSASNEDDGAKGDTNPADDPLNWAPDAASKIILTGRAKNSRNLHKEELTRSETEKAIHRQVQQNAPLEQQQKSKQENVHSQTKTSPIKAVSKSKSSEAAMSLADSLSSHQPAVAAGGSGHQTKPPGTSGGEVQKQKKIRVSTSDGRQLTLSLESDTTYAKLQAQLETELGVSAMRQRIKHGFPPRELVAPSEDKRDESLPIQHGDRLTVEILPDLSKPAPDRSPEPCPEMSSAAWGGPVGPSLDATSLLIKGLAELQDSSTNSLDSSIASLALMASLTGQDLWAYVQSMPHLFSIGGLFYEQVKRDLGLTDAKHCTLPSIPGKVFRYSEQNQCLELCLEPHGHFPVEPGIEERILGSTVWKEGSPGQDRSTGNVTKKSSAEISAEREVKQALTVGSSGIVLNKAMKFPKIHQAFSGQGHTLSGTSSKSNIQTTSANMETSDTETADADPVFVRVGPGCTVLNHQKTNEANQTSELFKSLAASIEAAVKESADMPVAPRMPVDPGEDLPKSPSSPVDLGADLSVAPRMPVDPVEDEPEAPRIPVDPGASVHTDLESVNSSTEPLVEGNSLSPVETMVNLPVEDKSEVVSSNDLIVKKNSDMCMELSNVTKNEVTEEDNVEMTEPSIIATAETPGDNDVNMTVADSSDAVTSGTAVVGNTLVPSSSNQMDTAVTSVVESSQQGNTEITVMDTDSKEKLETKVAEAMDT